MRHSWGKLPLFGVDHLFIVLFFAGIFRVLTAHGCFMSIVIICCIRETSTRSVAKPMRSASCLLAGVTLYPDDHNNLSIYSMASAIIHQSRCFFVSIGAYSKKNNAE